MPFKPKKELVTLPLQVITSSFLVSEAFKLIRLGGIRRFGVALDWKRKMHSPIRQPVELNAAW